MRQRRAQAPVGQPHTAHGQQPWGASCAEQGYALLPNRYFGKDDGTGGAMSTHMHTRTGCRVTMIHLHIAPSQAGIVA